MDGKKIRVFIKSKGKIAAGTELRYNYFQMLPPTAMKRECPWDKNVSFLVYNAAYS